MNSVKLAVLVSCVVIFCCATASAQQIGGQAANEEFPKIDANADGYITSQEMQAYQEARFNELDQDKSAAIDAEELKADQAGMFEKADQDKDGKISQQEADAQFKQYLNEMDANKDSMVSENEFKEYWPVVMQY